MLSLTSLAMRLDPVCMARSAGIEPDDWQANMLRSIAPRILLNCSRQVGKSTTVALLACHTALYQARAQVLMLAPSQRQSQELFRTTRDIWRRLGNPMPANADTLLRMELENGSRILALPGKEQGIRGLAAIDLLIVDESARVPEELYIALRPMLAVSGGRLVMLSTPAGTRGWWHDVWTNGDGYQRFSVRADECPRISKEFLASERAALGPRWYAQEYEAVFVDDISSVFRADEVDRMFDNEEKLWSIPTLAAKQASQLSLSRQEASRQASR